MKLYSATQILTLGGLVDTTYFKPEYAERGSFIHAATEYYDREDVDLDEQDLDPGIVPYLDGYKRFIEDYRPRWEGIEQILHDPDLLIAGTIDRWGSMVLPKTTERITVVLDIKSGSFAPSHAIQLSCYAHLLTRYLGVVYTGKLPLHRYAVYLTKRGTYRVKCFTDVSDLRVFLAAQAVVVWKERHNLLKG